MNRCALRALLVLSLGMTGTLEAATRSRDVQLSPDQVRIQEVEGRAVIEMTGAAHGLPLGHPDLPMISVTLELPDETRAGETRIVPLEWKTLGRGFTPIAVGEPGPGGVPRQATLDPRAVPAGGVYPESPLLGAHTGRMRGRTLAMVGVAPLSWHSGTGELRLLTRFRVEVTTESRPRNPEDLVILRESAEGARTFDPVIDALTHTRTPPGRNRVGMEINSGAPFAPTFRPTTDGSPVDMVIITSTAQEAEYQRLADFHTRTGIRAVVRTVDWVLSNYPDGVDIPERVRHFIRDAVSQWGTAWVLLGGDSPVIPPRLGYTTFYGTENIPTDLYYTDLDGNWNADGDNRFGEGNQGPTSPGDQLDLLPDVWVGRLTSNDAAEAQVLVDKTLLYATNPPLGYQKDLLFLGEILFPEDWIPGEFIQFDGAEINEDVVTILPPSLNAVRMYENYPAWAGSLPEDKPAVIDSINAGFHMVHHVGHGFINTMSVGIEAETLINSDANAFTNGNELFLLFAINCTSAAFDFNCIAERFMVNPLGGAMAVVGSTRLDFPSTNRPYQNNFMSSIYNETETRLGHAFALAKVPYVGFSQNDNTHRWTQFTQIYLGDPTLNFYTDVPVPLSATHSPTFTLGQGTFAVTVTDGGSPVEGATVALYKEGDAYGVAQTDPAGLATVTFRPDLTGDFTVGVTKRNALASIDTASVVAPSSPYLFADSQGIDDDLVGSSAGNSDGRIDAGEMIELNVALKNNGGTTETGIFATLSTSNPYLTISDNSSSYSDIAPAATVAPGDPFVVNVSRTAPDRLEAVCTLDVFGIEGTYSQDIILYVHAPVLQYREQDLDDSVGNGDGNGVIAANEDFAIVPSIRNTGLGDAVALEARLRSSDGAVTITDSVSVLGTVASGATVSSPGDPLQLRLSDVSSPHELRLVLVDSHGEISTTFLDITAPDTASNLVTFGDANGISLNWAPVASAGLWGYNVYRSGNPGGPFSLLNAGVAEGTSYYRDENLPPFTRYYYQVAAVDSSGNLGVPTPVVSGTTSLPLQGGFPVPVFTATTAGVNVGDLDGDGKLEILGGGDEVYAVTREGGDFFDGDLDVRTLGVLTELNDEVWCTPAVGDVDGDGDNEIAFVTWAGADVYVVDETGTPLPGWPKEGNINSIAFPAPLGSVCLADVDADGDLEVIVNVARHCLAWHHDGTELRDGDSNPATSGVLAATVSNYSFSTPTVANIDQEPRKEIVYTMRDGGVWVFEHDGTPYPGFPYMTPGNITASAAVADIDRDGNNEIIVASSNNASPAAPGQVHAIRSDLSQASGFPVNVDLFEDVDPSPSIGDVDGDGFLDIVITDYQGRLYVINGDDGTIQPNFPLQILNPQGSIAPVRASAALADVDGDGNVDITVSDYASQLHSFDNTGQYLDGFPIQLGNLTETAGPMVIDVDDDGLTEILLQSFDQNIYVWNTPWSFDEARAPWPMFKRNPRNSGSFDDEVLDVTGVGDPLPILGAALLQNAPNPFRLATTVRFRVPDGRPQSVTLRVFDLSGRLIRTLADDRREPGFHEITWDGSDDAGRPAAAGIYAYRLELEGRTLARKMVLLK